MKAVIIQEEGKAAVVDIQEQTQRPDYIKIKTIAVAINPTDFHHLAGAGRVGGILGCDVAGIVYEIGKDCTSDVKTGDIVYGVCHGANLNNSEDGAFAEYAMIKDGHLARVPANRTAVECASMGVGLTTVGQALYMTLKLPMPTGPSTDSFPILISGGSSATGTLAIQYAKLSGLRVVATASPASFDLVKSRGADVIVDYNDAKAAEQIRKYTENSLRYAFDCISTPDSYKLVAEAFPSENTESMHLITLLPAESWSREDVQTHTLLAYTTFGESFSKFGMDIPSIPEHFEFGKKFWKFHAKMVADGKVLPHPITEREGGLAGVISGITDVSLGTVKATKLVYRVDDSPISMENNTQQCVIAPSLTNWKVER